jgi:hypothetical protein
MKTILRILAVFCLILAVVWSLLGQYDRAAFMAALAASNAAIAEW